MEKLILSSDKQETELRIDESSDEGNMGNKNNSMERAFDVDVNATMTEYQSYAADEEPDRVYRSFRPSRGTFRSGIDIANQDSVSLNTGYFSECGPSVAGPLRGSFKFGIDIANQDNVSLKTDYFSEIEPSVEDYKLDSVKNNKISVAMSLPTGLSPQNRNIDQLPVSSRLKPKTKKKASVEKMEIKTLTNFYTKCNSIVLLIPFDISDTVKCMNYLRDTVAIIYKNMETLAPYLTFMRNSKWLKFKGSYYYDYGVCNFDAQVWKLDEKIAKSDHQEKEYIIEFRRRSLTGHSAFEQLLRRVASWLLESRRAAKYANGFNIYPYEEPSSNLGDGRDDAVFDSPVPSSVEDMSGSDSSCQISLDNDLICRWAKKISERSTYGEENIRILAMCSKDRENRELMASEPKLHEALCEELNNGRNPSSCANALVIVKAIFKFHANIAAESFINCGILLSVTRCLLLHSSYKPNVSLRSVAIERLALTLLEMLIENQELRFAQTQVERVWKELEKYLEGRLKDEKNDEKNNRCVNNVMSGLRKKIQVS